MGFRCAHRVGCCRGQVVVEDNTVTGASLSSAGNNIASYNGGYAALLSRC